MDNPAFDNSDIYLSSLLQPEYCSVSSFPHFADVKNFKVPLSSSSTLKSETDELTPFENTANDKIHLASLLQPEYCSVPSFQHYVDIKNIIPQPSTETETEKNELALLTEQLDYLHTQISGPQSLQLLGLEYIKLDCKLNNFKEKVDNLFFAADIPLYWILNVSWERSKNLFDKHNDNMVDIITVTLLNHFVRETTIEKLYSYLTTNFKNKIILRY